MMIYINYSITHISVQSLPPHPDSCYTHNEFPHWHKSNFLLTWLEILLVFFSWLLLIISEEGPLMHCLKKCNERRITPKQNINKTLLQMTQISIKYQSLYVSIFHQIHQQRDYEKVKYTKHIQLQRFLMTTNKDCDLISCIVTIHT
jgi:hypothetical protein